MTYTMSTSCGGGYVAVGLASWNLYGLIWCGALSSAAKIEDVLLVRMHRRRTTANRAPVLRSIGCADLKDQHRY